MFLLATAGMRLLPDDQRNELLKQVCSYTRSNTKFQLPECDVHIKVIPGEVEGLYGWVAANYLIGGFDSPKTHANGRDHHTYGFLDMGGASAQIAFAPNATEAERHANDLKLLRMRTVDGTPAEYRVFTTTWLGFGVNEARKRYIEALQNANDVTNPQVFQDPCLPAGLKTSTKGTIFDPGLKDINRQPPWLNGTGQFSTCLTKTLPLLEKDHVCEDDPCLLGGVHVPAIDFDVNHFVGVSEYWHTTHEIFQVDHKDKAYDFDTYQKRVDEFCSQDWGLISKGIHDKKWGKKVDEKTAMEVCFKASWLINVLHEGIGIPRVGLEGLPDRKHNGTKTVLDNAKDKGFTASFQAVNKIDETEVSWTLGKMVLYATSQIPPSTEEALPVGFGSNLAGVPQDFQYAGSETLMHPSNITNDRKDDNWHDNLFRASSPRRIPGFILFVFILVVAIYLFLGRRRRQRIVGRFAPPSRHDDHDSRKRRFLPRNIPFLRSKSGSGRYESLLEEGLTGDNFELGSVDDGSDDVDTSDSSTSSHAAGKTSGWVTPRSRSSLAVNESRERFDSLGVGQGLGLSGNPMSRSGLTSRTDSRERLSVMADGRRSRKASPSRSKGLALGPLVEDG